MISVLMPIYNCDRYILSAIGSIREQVFKNTEIVVVNDGSTDASSEILKLIAREDKRIVLLEQANKGIVEALNAGLAVCRGEFIARMDGDDLSLPDRLEKQLRFLLENTSVSAVGGQFQTFVGDEPPADVSRLPLRHEEIDAMLLRTAGQGFLHPAVMMRRTDLVAVGGYRAAYPYAEDLDLFLRMAERGRLANLPDSIYLYRRHSEAVSLKHRAKQARSACEVVAETQRRRKVLLGPILSSHADRASWSALAEGDLREARRYAMKALLWNPTSLRSLRPLARFVRSSVSGLVGGARSLRTS